MDWMQQEGKRAVTEIERLRRYADNRTDGGNCEL